ncbi:hypothetical protein [Hyphomonas sp.]|uniref:hypothetical protein n=1 Tax=Hyphomonas sp. TaxID=87 RepID=UPI003528C299
MKLMTVLAVASVAFAGVACSESNAKTASETTDQVAVQEPSGTLNLSLPGSVDETSVPGGTLNLNLGGASDQPRLIGSDQLGSVDFNKDVPAPIFIGEEDEPAADEDDDIIRLDPN